MRREKKVNVMDTGKAGRWVAVGCLVAVGTLLTVLGGPPEVNNSLAVWFVEDDPARLAYESFQDLFGNDEVVIVSVGEPGTVLTSGLLDQVAEAAIGMSEVEGIASVTGPGGASTGPLSELLLSHDKSVALLLARFDVLDDADARRHDIIEGLREAVADLDSSGAELHWAGIGLVYDELNEVSFRETPLLTGASFVIVGLVLYAVVGSLAPVLLALASVVTAILVLLGTFTLGGFQLNMVTAILPTLLLVVGTANAVHIFTRIRGAEGESREEALRNVFKPCLFTALTTAAGFASLATAQMSVIRDLGIFAALGVVISLVTSFVFLRAGISADWFHLGPARSPRSRVFLEWLSGFVVRRPWQILSASVAVALVALWFATSVVVDTYSIEFFRADHPVRVDSDAIEAGYGWYLPLEFAVHSNEPGGAVDPELAVAVADWQTSVEEAGLAQWSISLADFGPTSRGPVHAAGRGTLVMPEQGRPQDAFLVAADPLAADSMVADLVAAGLVDEERSALRVTFGVPMASASAWAERIEAIRANAGPSLQTVQADTELTSGGYLPLYVRMMDYIVDTQVRSFTAALVLVFAIMGIFLRAPRMVLVALFPNLLPIVAIFGVMGALGIRLDIATVTVATIALGIVVDDTVHLLHRFREEMDRTGDPLEAVRTAMTAVGPALMGTTVILSTSFAVLGLASVLSIALFGLLSAATLVFALFADLLVLPAVLVVSERRRDPRQPRSRVEKNHDHHC